MKQQKIECIWEMKEQILKNFLEIKDCLLTSHIKLNTIDFEATA
jgi:hypothetical protein